MAQWMGKVGFELQPLADYVLERIKQGERVFADETTLPTLCAGDRQDPKGLAVGVCARRNAVRRNQPANGRLSL